jgi:hypothetical protein
MANFRFPSYTLPMVEVESIRDFEEVMLLIWAIEKDLKETPDRNIWGESNAEGKRECRRIIRELKCYLENGTVPRYGEAWYFLTGHKADGLYNTYLKELYEDN